MAVQSENCDFFTYIERTQQSDFRDGIILWPEYSVFEDVQTSRWPMCRSCRFTIASWKAMSSV
jgi:hypothetical protein